MQPSQCLHIDWDPSVVLDTNLPFRASQGSPHQPALDEQCFVERVSIIAGKSPQHQGAALTFSNFVELTPWIHLKRPWNNEHRLAVSGSEFSRQETCDGLRRLILHGRVFAASASQLLRALRDFTCPSTRGAGSTIRVGS